MKRTIVTASALVVLVATVSFLLTPSAWAVPSYSRRFGVECSGCHTMWGALNGAGVTFRLSGYRAMNGKELTPIEKDVELSAGNTIPGSFPFSIISGVGFDSSTTKREAADGTSSTRTGSSLALEDSSLFLTSPIGQHLSAFIEFPMFETKNGEFLPTGPAEANDTTTTGAIQFSAEKPVFEVAKFWWNNLFGDAAPRDSVNLLGGITHLPLGYASGKVRLSVNQYPIYERRALDLISPKKVDEEIFASDPEAGESLFRLSEPQVLFEVNGMVVPSGVAEVSKKETFWFEYHLGMTNGSEEKADNNNQKDLYGRFVMRWYRQSLGVFVYDSPDNYSNAIRDAGKAAGVMSGKQSHNGSTRLGVDATLSLAAIGIPVWLENQYMTNKEDDPTGFGVEFKWQGGFDQLNWQVSKKAIVYARYDWIKGNSFDDTTKSVNGVSGVTKSKPGETDIVAGAQYLVQQNVKLIGEYRHDVFEDTAAQPNKSRITTDGYTVRAMVGF
jgi:hypothetical protein